MYVRVYEGDNDEQKRKNLKRLIHKKTHCLSSNCPRLKFKRLECQPISKYFIHLDGLTPFWGTQQYKDHTSNSLRQQ